MPADRIFPRFSGLLDIRVTRDAPAYLRLNADGTVDQLSAADMVTALGVSGGQPPAGTGIPSVLNGAWSSVLSIGTSSGTIAAGNHTHAGVYAPAIQTKTSNFTATVGGRYITEGTVIVTDPTTRADASDLVVGDSYELCIGSGTATIGGTSYYPSRMYIRRRWTGSAWATPLLVSTDAATLTGGLTLGGAISYNSTSAFSYANSATSDAHLTALGVQATGLALAKSATSSAARDAAGLAWGIVSTGAWASNTILLLQNLATNKIYRLTTFGRFGGSDYEMLGLAWSADNGSSLINWTTAGGSLQTFYVNGGTFGNGGSSDATDITAMLTPATLYARDFFLEIMFCVGSASGGAWAKFDLGLTSDNSARRYFKRGYVHSWAGIAAIPNALKLYGTVYGSKSLAASNYILESAYLPNAQ